jgi:hypothetical protein
VAFEKDTHANIIKIHGKRIVWNHLAHGSMLANDESG